VTAQLQSLASDLAAQTVATDDIGVFKPNKSAPIHRWVSFTEGFSAQLVRNALSGFKPSTTFVFDPFGGTGTTPLVAAQLGFSAAWAEVNPYLQEVATTKVAAAVASREEREHALEQLEPAEMSQHPLLQANESRAFFAPETAFELVHWTHTFDALEDELARRLGRVAVASCAIEVSNMKRAVDLRRRTETELLAPRPRARDLIAERVLQIASDLDSTTVATGKASLVSTDARSLPADMPEIDLIVTSPPYLNGTNYFRNTKLELLLLELLASEGDLAHHRSRAITAGINNVSRRIADPVPIACVEEVAERLDLVTYDARIPRMVRAYFADMQLVFRTLREAMSDAGSMVLDIGDSRFAGIAVDTPTLLARIAESQGWSCSKVETIRARTSKDGGKLCQKLLYLSSI
jgi:hypothetical protein